MLIVLRDRHWASQPGVAARTGHMEIMALPFVLYSQIENGNCCSCANVAMAYIFKLPLTSLTLGPWASRSLSSYQMPVRTVSTNNHESH